MIPEVTETDLCNYSITQSVAWDVYDFKLPFLNILMPLFVTYLHFEIKLSLPPGKNLCMDYGRIIIYT